MAVGSLSDYMGAVNANQNNASIPTQAPNMSQAQLLQQQLAGMAPKLQGAGGQNQQILQGLNGMQQGMLPPGVSGPFQPGGGAPNGNAYNQVLGGLAGSMFGQQHPNQPSPYGTPNPSQYNQILGGLAGSMFGQPHPSQGMPQGSPLNQIPGSNQGILPGHVPGTFQPGGGAPNSNPYNPVLGGYVGSMMNGAQTQASPYGSPNPNQSQGTLPGRVPGTFQPGGGAPGSNPAGGLANQFMHSPAMSQQAFLNAAQGAMNHNASPLASQVGAMMNNMQSQPSPYGSPNPNQSQGTLPGHVPGTFQPGGGAPRTGQLPGQVSTGPYQPRAVTPSAAPTANAAATNGATWTTSLNATDQRNWSQLNRIKMDGGTFTPRQQQMYNQLSHQLASQGVKNTTSGINAANYKAPSDISMDGISKHDQNDWRIMNNILADNGVLTKAQRTEYNRILGTVKGNASQSQIQQWSLGALNGDKHDANIMKQLGIKPLTGDALWKGLKSPPLNTPEARTAFARANPNDPWTQHYYQDNYNNVNNMLMNGQAVSGDEMKWYKSYVQANNLKDMTDPFNQQYLQTQNAEKQQFNNEKINLNNQLQSSDALNEQNMLKAQQDEANKGLQDSGFAQNAYAQATLQTNQDYQKAYAADAAANNTIIDNTEKQLEGITNDQATAQNTAAKNAADAQIALMNAQTNQDKMLSQYTGYAWLGGKMLTNKDGSPMTTIQFAQLQETARHNKATEANAAQANGITAQNDAWNYAINQQKNTITAQNDTNNYNLGMAKVQESITNDANNFKVNMAKIGIDQQNADTNLMKAKGDLQIAMQNATTAADRAQITAVSKQMDSVQKQIDAWQKANPGKTLPPNSALAKAYAKLGSELDGINSALGKN